MNKIRYYLYATKPLVLFFMEIFKISFKFWTLQRMCVEKGEELSPSESPFSPAVKELF